MRYKVKTQYWRIRHNFYILPTIIYHKWIQAITFTWGEWHWQFSWTNFGETKVKPKTDE